MPLKQLILPKQTAEIDKLYYSLEIYNNIGTDDGWLSNDDYVAEMRKKFQTLRNSDHSNVRKQCQIANYYGFLEHNNQRRLKRITPLGVEILNAKDNSNRTVGIFLNSLNDITFGKNNTAVTYCNSIVEAPKLFLFSIFHLEYLTNNEFIFLMNEIHEKENNVYELFDVIVSSRKNNFDYESYILEQDIERFNDNKVGTFSKNIGIVTYSNNKYSILKTIRKQYGSLLSNLMYINTIPKIKNFTPAIELNESIKKYIQYVENESADINEADKQYKNLIDKIIDPSVDKDDKEDIVRKSAAITGKKAQDQFENWCKAKGWECKDVSDTHNLGYDFECVDEKGKEIFVEVKGCRGNIESIRFTKKEWQTAEEKNDNYYLMIVFNMDEEAEFFSIRDPYSIFNKLIEGPKYTVSISYHLNKKHLVEVKD